ncbi:hypothetical protein BDQ17DRAFT_1372877 [Cyathus striatus]|nr:hypothetical protein BDQ17DRAFT_1372877 [Cyathus striatus]
MQMDFHSSSNLGLGFSHSDQHQTVNAVSAESISGSMNPSAFHYYPSPSLPMSSTPQHEYISAPHPDVDSNFVTRPGQSNQNVAKRS